ncbi:hypothetical protein Lal_00025788 [Lupinus albus]|nr:hypothetical protein Lal_00025788 [Lupinus albus]
MMSGLINANPTIYEKKERRVRTTPSFSDQDDAVEPIDQLEDPEHPYSLEELKVITEEAVEVDDKKSYGYVYSDSGTLQYGHNYRTLLTSQAHEKLRNEERGRGRSREKTEILDFQMEGPTYLTGKHVDIRVAPGSHATEAAVNKQLNDKERVAAALENPNLLDMVDECLAPSYD